MDNSLAEITRRVTAVLGLENRPVAVTFTNEEVGAAGGGKTAMCQAIKMAAAGRSLVIDRETSGCPGGSWHCGLTAPPGGEAGRALRHFLTRGEKLTASIVTFHRMQALGSPPPTGMSERIVITPLPDAPMSPDLVLFLCSAEQACRLLTLDQYWDGVPPRVDVSGSLCHSAITYPAVTGNTNVTFGDWTARRMQKYESGVVFLTVPFERMANLLSAIPECSAGTAAVEIPDDIRRRMSEG